jgi:hypothetical protein
LHLRYSDMLTIPFPLYTSRQSGVGKQQAVEANRAALETLLNQVCARQMCVRV